MNLEIKKQLDLTGIVCPMNFVKTKAALATLESGDLLELILDEGDAILNVPRSLKDEGETVVKVTLRNDGTSYTVLVRKC